MGYIASGEQDRYELLDDIARRYYSSYYTLVRDPSDPFEVEGATPDIVAGESPSMTKSDIRRLAVVGTSKEVSTSIPSSWSTVIKVAAANAWEIDIFVPKAFAKNVLSWAISLYDRVNIIGL